MRLRNQRGCEHLRRQGMLMSIRSIKCSWLFPDPSVLAVCGWLPLSPPLLPTLFAHGS